YVRPAAHVVHVASPHREMIARIYQQYGISYELCEVCPEVENGDVVMEHEPEVQTGTIRVHRAGANTAASLCEACENLCDGCGARPFPLELPLAQPEPGKAGRAAEEVGFFSTGLGPAFAADAEALLMQYLPENLTLPLTGSETPFPKNPPPTSVASATES